MYVDKNLILSGGATAAGVQTFQTITGTGQVKSDNVIDLQVARDIGAGQDLVARISVGTAFAGATSVRAEIVAAATANLNSQPLVVGATGDMPVAMLTAGARLAIPIQPLVNSTGRRYLGLIFTVTGTSTAGTVFADIGLMVDDSPTGQKAYASGFTVL